MDVSKIIDDPTASGFIMWILGFAVIEIAILLRARHYFRQARTEDWLTKPPGGSRPPTEKAQRLFYWFIGLLPIPVGLMILLDMYLSGQLPAS